MIVSYFIEFFLIGKIGFSFDLISDPLGTATGVVLRFSSYKSLVFLVSSYKS